MKRLALLLLGMTSLCMYQAHAHTRLAGATPANAAVTSTAPQEIVLEFNADVRLLAVTLEGTDAQTIALDPVSDAQQQRFTVAILADLAPGDYLVTWRAVGADTHVVSGEIHFIVAREDALASRLSPHP